MADQTAPSPAPSPATPWYAGVTRYQWLVLAIASAGWVFDTFEGQIFNLTRGDLLNDLLKGHADLAAQKQLWGDRFQSSDTALAIIGCIGADLHIRLSFLAPAGEQRRRQADGRGGDRQDVCRTPAR